MTTPHHGVRAYAPSSSLVRAISQCRQTKTEPNGGLGCHCDWLTYGGASRIHAGSGGILLSVSLATFPVQFAVRPDLSSTALSLAARLGHLQTPIAILLDSDGKARMAIRGFGATPRQLDVEQLVMDYRHIAI